MKISRKSHSAVPVESKAPLKDIGELHFTDNRKETSQLREIASLANMHVAQLVRTDSGIPRDLIDFLARKKTTYHDFKKGNWSLIARAHEVAHSSPPSTTGAKFTIDPKTATALIKILTEMDWEPHDDESRAEAIEASASASKKRRAKRKKRGDAGPSRNKGAMKTIDRFLKTSETTLSREAIYDLIPTDIISSRKKVASWLTSNIKDEEEASDSGESSSSEGEGPVATATATTYVEEEHEGESSTGS